MGRGQGLQRRLLCGVTVLVPVRFLHLVKKRASERDAVFLNVTATAVSGEARDMGKAQPRGGGGGQRVPLWPLPGRGLWDTAGGRGRGHTCAQPPDGAPAQSPGLRHPPVLSGLSAAVPARWGPGGHGEGGGRSTMGSPCVPPQGPGFAVTHHSRHSVCLGLPGPQWVLPWDPSVCVCGRSCSPSQGPGPRPAARSCPAPVAGAGPGPPLAGCPGSPASHRL